MKKTLHNLELNELWVDTSVGNWYRRVPGGWLFQDKIFIPWSNEFNIKPLIAATV